MKGEPVFRATAPVRLDFAGGWTDVAPFASERRGAVVNAAIELRTHAEVRTGGAGYRIHSDDLRLSLEGPTLDRLDGCRELHLLTAALGRAGIGPCALRTRADVPPGSGLGSSGALGVSVTAALDAACGRDRPAEELAEEAWRTEVGDARLAGGKQDQYAAALGGFHHFTFEGGAVTVRPLRLDPEFRALLAARVVLCYTGASRLSSRTIARVMESYRRREPVTVRALDGLVEAADRMAQALEAADLAAVARCLDENWRWQQDLDMGMRTPEMVRLEMAMREAGALAGKATGAGAGGSMFFVMGGRPERGVDAARGMGATVLPFTWAVHGVVRP
jgi:D-glycero-alpha-D-manno-heptose-7-phosphate kinase